MVRPQEHVRGYTKNPETPVFTAPLKTQENKTNGRRESLGRDPCKEDDCSRRCERDQVPCLGWWARDLRLSVLGQQPSRF